MMLWFCKAIGSFLNFDGQMLHNYVTVPEIKKVLTNSLFSIFRYFIMMNRIDLAEKALMELKSVAGDCAVVNMAICKHPKMSLI